MQEFVDRTSTTVSKSDNFESKCRKNVISDSPACWVISRVVVAR